MASLTNCRPMVRFRLLAIRERWGVRCWRTVRFHRRVIQERWALPAVRSCQLDSNRSLRHFVILPGDRFRALEPGNVT